MVVAVGARTDNPVNQVLPDHPEHRVKRAHQETPEHPVAMATQAHPVPREESKTVPPADKAQLETPVKTPSVVKRETKDLADRPVAKARPETTPQRSVPQAGMETQARKVRPVWPAHPEPQEPREPPADPETRVLPARTLNIARAPSAPRLPPRPKLRPRPRLKLRLRPRPKRLDDG
jgi:hypothetical protein